MTSSPQPADSWRLIAAEQSPQWTGDLKDDCTALWAGFTLRAEWMHSHAWRWCVYDGEGDQHEQVASSNDEPGKWTSGKAARRAAEAAARRLLGLRPGRDG